MEHPVAAVAQACSRAWAPPVAALAAEVGPAVAVALAPAVASVDAVAPAAAADELRAAQA